MSKLQNAILAKYKKAYPEHTLSDIAKNTNIQITRVFRIFNGYDMKVSELEAFENALMNGSRKEFISMADDCFQNLSDSKIEYLRAMFKSSLKLAQAQTQVNYSNLIQA